MTVFLVILNLSGGIVSLPMSSHTLCKEQLVQFKARSYVDAYCVVTTEQR